MKYFTLKSRITRFFLLFLVAGFSLGNGKTRAQSFETALRDYVSKVPQQKIYIHYDREIYGAGETIWFKAYIYNQGLPDITVNNLYVRLIDPNKKIINSYKFPVSGATAKGSIDLPDSLKEGFYEISALTPSALNGDPGFFYRKKIAVVNRSTGALAKTDSAVSNNLVLKFYPESGNLVEEILTVLAFKATDNWGNPRHVSGFIRTEEGSNIAPFSTGHDGIGKMQFKPQAGKKYIAVVNSNGGDSYFPLPATQPSGINLRVENESGGKMFLLTRSKKNKTEFDKVWLVAALNNRIIYENEIYFDSYYSVKGHLLTDSMPSGILRFTVLNKDLMPLAERICFVNNGEFISNAEIILTKKGTGQRQENEWSVNFSDTLQRSCSVSITDFSATPYPKTDNIISRLFLTADLKGYIHNPAWYFQNNTDSVKKALDNLMMVHGWTRYTWQKLLTGDGPPAAAKDNYLLSVSGTLKNSKTKSPVNRGQLYLFIDSEDSVNQSFEINVNADGSFRADSLLIFGNSKFFYTYKSAQGKEVAVDITLNQDESDRAAEAIAFSPDVEDILPVSINEYLRQNAGSFQWKTAKSRLGETKELAPVLVEAGKKKRPIDLVNEKYTKGVFSGMGKINIDNINEPVNDKSLSVYDYIRNFIRQVEVQDNNFVNRRSFSLTRPMTQQEEKAKQEKIDAYLRTPNGNNAQKTNDLLNENAAGKKFIVTTFLNESPVDISFLKTIRMEEVALLKFYEPGFIGAGSGGPGGALSIYTKQTDIRGTPASSEKMDYVQYKGYSLVKDFYHPDYSKPSEDTEWEDNRPTLYWNPDVINKDNRLSATFRFYNNDRTKKFRVIVEGFDAIGRLIYIEKIITD